MTIKIYKEKRLKKFHFAGTDFNKDRIVYLLERKCLLQKEVKPIFYETLETNLQIFSFYLQIYKRETGMASHILEILA